MLFHFMRGNSAHFKAGMCSKTMCFLLFIWAFEHLKPDNSPNWCVHSTLFQVLVMQKTKGRGIWTSHIPSIYMYVHVCTNIPMLFSYGGADHGLCWKRSTQHVCIAGDKFLVNERTWCYVFLAELSVQWRNSFIWSTMDRQTIFRV